MIRALFPPNRHQVKRDGEETERRTSKHRQASPPLPSPSISVTWRSFSGGVLNRDEPAKSGGRKRVMLKKQRLTQKSGGFWAIRIRSDRLRLVPPPEYKPLRDSDDKPMMVESSLETRTGIRFLYSLRFTQPGTLTHTCTYILLFL